MGTRCSLGMVLNGKDRCAFVAQTLARLIVEIDLRGLDFTCGERFQVDGKAMILRGDADPGQW